MDTRPDERGRQVRAGLLGALAAALAAALAWSPSAAAGPTGRVLVMLEPAGGPRAQASAARAFLSRSGARRAGPAVPEIGLVTVDLPAGRSFHSFARALRKDPAVRSVQAEGRMTLRANDPALTTAETAPGTPPGTPQEWPALRQGFPGAWAFSTGAGAIVGVIDTGVDGGHPELAGKLADAVNRDPGSASATTDENGHGTHVASLACAATDNGLGIAGAGHHCGLLIEKTDLTDASIADSIVDAANRGVLSLNMSFGDEQPRSPVAAILAAVDFAFRRQVVMVAAARDDRNFEDQGQPANLLQPSGTGPDINAGKGLSVTAATIEDRPTTAGAGSQISMSAAGTMFGFSDSRGPPGILGAAPPGHADLLDGPLPFVSNACGCRTQLQGASFAYLQGTSMAAPQIAGIAALMRRLNPDLGASDVIRTLKGTARRSAGAWTPELGWGVLDAAVALQVAARTDRRRPVSRLRAPRRPRPGRFRIRWSASDPSPPGVRASGLAAFEVWRATGRGRPRRIARTRRRSILVRGARGVRYSFFTIAVDRAGNREARPRRSDAVTLVRRR